MEVKLYKHQSDLVNLGPTKHLLAWGTGCISGDTIVKYNRAKITRTVTIKRLFEIEKHPRSTRKNSIKTYIQSDKYGIIGLNLLKDIVFSGNKNVFNLELENGYNIKATKDHKFLTETGWKKLELLKINDTIATNDDSCHKKTKKKYYLQTKGLKYHPFANNILVKRGDRKNKTYNIYRLETHRVIYEAHINKLRLEEYKYILRNCEFKAKKLKYINPKKYHIHHKDGNVLNNNINNLEKLTQKKHIKIHELYRNFPNTKRTFKKIISIKDCGIEETYDISCKSPHNNYIANGIIVHNSGKTLACIKLVELYDLHNVLVVCPKSIKEKWKREVEIFAKEPGLFTVVTKEEFKKRWENLTGFKKIIVDEAHYFSGTKSALHKTMIKWLIKNNPRQIYLATATPYLSTVWNIFALGNILGKGWKWQEWNKYFFYQIPMGNRKIPKQKDIIDGVPVKKIVAGIINSKLGNTVRLEDCVDVPDQTFLVEEFTLTKEQERGIEEIDDVNHIVYWTKSHQINGGTLKSDGYTEDKFFKCEKLDRVVDLCKEHKKIIIVSRYNNEIDRIQAVLKRNKKKVFVINGKTKDKDTVTLQAELCEECVVLVNAACSEGYELPSFPIMVFYSYDFSLKNYIQMIGRIQRINNIKKNVYISLINKGTIDEDVYKTIQRKEDFQIEIYK